MSDHDDQHLVLPEHACPVCSERDTDRLVWIDDERVQCQMCGTVYAPGEVTDEPT